ncbi:hypothetical protein C8R43DRAFT_949936 [Mycena crocata]|nr:hypothetical protein C8R43DRAFT_949936 [Mycena crocata]
MRTLHNGADDAKTKIDGLDGIKIRRPMVHAASMASEGYQSWGLVTVGFVGVNAYKHKSIHVQVTQVNQAKFKLRLVRKSIWQVSRVTLRSTSLGFKYWLTVIYWQRNTLPTAAGRSAYRPPAAPTAFASNSKRESPVHLAGHRSYQPSQFTPLVIELASILLVAFGTSFQLALVHIPNAFAHGKMKLGAYMSAPLPTSDNDFKRLILRTTQRRWV